MGQHLVLPTNLWDLVASAGGLTLPVADPDQARLFVQVAAGEGLLPSLATAPPRDPLVAETLVANRGLFLALSRRAERIRSTIQRIPGILGSIPIIFLKGADWRERYYPSLDLRPMSDVDVLVPIDRMREVAIQMESRGFTPTCETFAKRHRSYPDIAYDLDGMTVEVHHSFFHRSRASIDYDRVWSRAEPAHICGVDTLRLDAVDSFLLAIINVAKTDMVAPLLRFLDLWLMIRSESGILERALQRAAEWKIENSYYAVTTMTHGLFLDLPKPAVSLGPVRRGIIDRRVLGPLHERARRIKLLERKLWLIDTWKLRACFATNQMVATAAGWLASKRDRI